MRPESVQIIKKNRRETNSGGAQANLSLGISARWTDGSRSPLSQPPNAPRSRADRSWQLDVLLSPQGQASHGTAARCPSVGLGWRCCQASLCSSEDVAGAATGERKGEPEIFRPTAPYCLELAMQFSRVITDARSYLSNAFARAP